MFYVYTLIIPILIILLSVWTKEDKIKEISSLVNTLFQIIPHLFGYAFLIYFLETESYIDSSWAFYTIIFYLIPICIIILFLKIFFVIRKWNCLDNAIIENFFGILKSELFYTQNFNSIKELKTEIKKYINYYNNQRIKSNLNKMSPIKYRTHFYQN